MPNILIKIPSDAFTGDARSQLMQLINDAAVSVEQISAEPKSRFLTWVLIEELQKGAFTCAGIDMTDQILPCIAVIYVPMGVLDEASRATYVDSVHKAFQQAMPAQERRKLVTSIMLQDVADGTWGANGNIWCLHDFVKAAGYQHLQALSAGVNV
jgi:phenylpyruvate tautomerase PptA (4-oxalocrotonate tautomerase family)